MSATFSLFSRKSEIAAFTSFSVSTPSKRNPSLVPCSAGVRVTVMRLNITLSREKKSPERSIRVGALVFVEPLRGLASRE